MKVKQLYKEITDKKELQDYQVFRFQITYRGVTKINDFEKIVYYTNYKYTYEYYYDSNILTKVLIYK